MGDYIMSTIKANDIQNASGGIPTVKGQRLIPTAWVNFNGTVAGSAPNTVAIRDSENVSSITDVDVGKYTVNFTTAMANANYGLSVSSGRLSTAGSRVMVTAITTGSCSVFTINNADSAVDTVLVGVIVMGGQA